MDEGYYYEDDDEGMESYYYGEEYEDEGMNDDYYEGLFQSAIRIDCHCHSVFAVDNVALKMMWFFL